MNFFWLIFLLHILFIIPGKSQVVNFSDEKFKQALITTKCVDINDDGIADEDADINNNAEIEISEAEAITSLLVSFKSITSMDGIDKFKNLVKLKCNSNRLSDLTLTNHSFLTTIDVGSNDLKTLSISNLNMLESLNLSGNDFDSLNISNMPNLIDLKVGSLFLIKKLVVTNNPKLTELKLNNFNGTFEDITTLTYLDCSGNNLTAINPTNNPLSYLNCSRNQITYLNSNWLGLNITIDASDNKISKSFEINAIFGVQKLNIKNNLIEKIVFGSWDLVSYDFSGNPLKSIIIYGATQNNIDIFGLPNLNSFEISNSNGQIYYNRNLNLSNLPELTYVRTGTALFSNLQFKDLPKLSNIITAAETLKLENLDGLKTLSIGADYKIKKLSISSLNNLQSLSISELTMDELMIDNVNQLKTISLRIVKIPILNLSRHPNLSNLSLIGLTTANTIIENLPELSFIKFEQIKSNLFLNNLPKLTTFIFDNVSNKTEEISLNSLENLTEIMVDNMELLNKLEFINLPILKTLKLRSMYKVKELNLFNLPSLEYFSFDAYNIDYVLPHIITFNNLPKLSEIYLSTLNLAMLDLINLPSLNKVKMERIQCIGAPILQDLPLLKELEISELNFLSLLDLVNLPNLRSVKISKNLKELNRFSLRVNNLQSLTYLEINSTQLSHAFEVIDFPKLDTLIYYENTSQKLPNYLIIDKLPSLKLLKTYVLFLNKNEFYDVNITNHVNLQYLGLNVGIGSLPATSINLENLPALTDFYCVTPKIKVDFSSSPLIENIDIHIADELNLNNGTNTLKRISGIAYKVCVDGESEIQTLKTLNSGFKLNKAIVFDSNCVTQPVNKFNSIRGQINYGNSISDCNKPLKSMYNVQLDLNTSGQRISLYPDEKGLYNFNTTLVNSPIEITPKTEIQYYTITPSTVIKTFDSLGGMIFKNDLCLIPSGVFNDLDITIIPITQARPGFESKYKIIVRNKGTTTQSGSIFFEFESLTASYVSSIPAANSIQNGHLIWDILPLQPFESREIIIALKLNTTTSNPPLNSGDLLNFVSKVIIASSEESPFDNEFNLKQTVVNSFDPNDKVCLQGDKITKDFIGNFVDYLIRFENKGTAEAVHVIIRDTIDIQKFDINSLIPLHSSHPFVCRIINGNILEFLFENINLSYEDSTNNGYIAFKIKTLGALNAGDILRNKAAIYFDYNPTIITNLAETQILNPISVNDHFKNIKVFPNPVSDILYFEIDNSSKSQIEIFTMDDKLILNQILSDNKVDLSSLQNGIFIIKLRNGNNQWIFKIVKY